jgi:hypothetical protein
VRGTTDMTMGIGVETVEGSFYFPYRFRGRFDRLWTDLGFLLGQLRELTRRRTDWRAHVDDFSDSPNCVSRSMTTAA